MGGIVCTLTKLYCASGCDASVVASALAFHPPVPPFYDIMLNKETKQYNIVFSDDVPGIDPRFKGHIIIDIISTKTKTQVPVVCCKVEGAKFTIIYSHGNATDIGAMFSRFISLSVSLNVNVVGYDYTGYGVSPGSPTEKQTYKDIKAVYQWCIDTSTVSDPAKEIIIYGQSIGSGPSCFISSTEPVAGMVLHSGILSGIRVLTASRLLACFDIFPNISRIKKVKAPVFIIHGEDDREVTVSHGRSLYEKCPEQYKYPPWFVPERGHNDICLDNETQYIKKLKAFLQYVSKPKGTDLSMIDASAGGFCSQN